ncbi:MAG: M56 family metallopeptidase [Clostridia bacterium]|nr:M56 family metallopeptidase [Clostridia bacterium]
MIKLLLTLLGLSASLTVGGTAALLFRRTRVGRRGKAVCAVWTIVLLLTVIPLRLPAADLPLTLFGETGSRAIITLEEDAPLRDAWLSEEENAQQAPSAPTSPERPPHAEALLRLLPTALVLLWLAGIAVAFGMTLHRTASIASSLRACSVAVTPDDERCRTLAACCSAAKLKHLPELRIFNQEIVYPPCTTGIFAPCIYLPQELPETADLCAILAHELSHIRRRDVLRRMIARILLALHWFNPITYLLLPRINADLELACDTDTLALLGRITGEDRRAVYMQTLLDTALAIQHAAPEAALAITEGSSGHQLKRRFQQMTHPRPRLTVLVSLLLILAMLATSAIAFTACTQLSANEDLLAYDLHPLVDRILRYHYDLAPTDTITREMLEGITSLQILRHSMTFTDVTQTRTLIDFRVNHLSAEEPLSFIQMKKNFFERSVLPLIPDKRNQSRLRSFYMYDPDSAPYYRLLDDASRAEEVTLFSLLYDYGILEPQFIDSTVIDTTIFDVFPNLTTLELVGLTAAN